MKRKNKSGNQKMAKKVVKIFVNQLTENGAYKYPWIRQDLGEGEFTTSLNTCYFKGKTFTKIKGGGAKGGNYKCKEDGEEYRISRY